MWFPEEKKLTDILFNTYGCLLIEKLIKDDYFKNKIFKNILPQLSSYIVSSPSCFVVDKILHIPSSEKKMLSLLHSNISKCVPFRETDGGVDALIKSYELISGRVVPEPGESTDQNPADGQNTEGQNDEEVDQEDEQNESDNIQNDQEDQPDPTEQDEQNDEEVDQENEQNESDNIQNDQEDQPDPTEQVDEDNQNEDQESGDEEENDTQHQESAEE